jgi:hypothetical protein
MNSDLGDWGKGAGDFVENLIPKSLRKIPRPQAI